MAFWSFGLGFRASDLGFRVLGLGFRASDLGFRAFGGLRFVKVWGLRPGTNFGGRCTNFDWCLFLQVVERSHFGSRSLQDQRFK